MTSYISSSFHLHFEEIESIMNIYHKQTLGGDMFNSEIHHIASSGKSEVIQGPAGRC